MIHNRPRIYSIDLLKAIAILGVVVIHTCSLGYYRPLMSFDWISTVFFRCLAGASVPLFFMCSGALLLQPKKELSTKRLFTKNLPRIVVALLIWAVVYQALELLLAGTFTRAALVRAAKDIVLFKHEFHLYFLHIMILVYLFLPISRILVKHASQDELRYALLLWFVFGIVYPTVSGFWPFNRIAGIPQQWKMNMAYAAIGYTLAGYYLSEYRLSLTWSISLAVLGFATVFGGTLWMSQQKNLLYTDFLQGMTVGIAALAFGIFGLCTAATRRKGARFVAALSKSSFCIYLVHVVFILLLQPLGVSLFSPYLVSIPLFVLVNFLLSYAVYLLLHRIPILKDWII